MDERVKRKSIVDKKIVIGACLLQAEGLMLVCEGNYRKYLMPRHAYKLMKGTKIGDVLMLTDFKPTKSREAITCPLLPDEIQKFLQEQCVPKFQTTTLTFTALQVLITIYVRLSYFVRNVEAFVECWEK